MKYPNGYFREKACRGCLTVFTPDSPCRMYCSEECSRNGLRNAYLKRNYSISIEDYNEMLLLQEDRCKICYGEGFTMADHHKIKLVVDHCHETGTIRGLLCHNCNRALGLLQEDSEVIKNALDYVS